MSFEIIYIIYCSSSTHSFSLSLSLSLVFGSSTFPVEMEVAGHDLHCLYAVLCSSTFPQASVGAVSLANASMLNYKTACHSTSPSTISPVFKCNLCIADCTSDVPKNACWASAPHRRPTSTLPKASNTDHHWPENWKISVHLPTVVAGGDGWVLSPEDLMDDDGGMCSKEFVNTVQLRDSTEIYVEFHRYPRSSWFK